MKKLLFVYDSMILGGTSTALIPLLDTIDYSQYSVDLLLYDHDGPFMDYIPKQVNLLEPAYKKTKLLSSAAKKILLTALNGQLLKSLFLYPKYRNTPKGDFRFMLAHASAKSQVAISRKLEQEYDVAIGYIERWSDHYVLSNKVKAKKKIVWVHQDYKDSYLVPEFDEKIYRHADRVVMVSDLCVKNFQNAFPEYAHKADIMENIVSTKFIEQRAEKEEVQIKKKGLNFATVCRCSIPVKGLDRVLDVFVRLREDGLLDDVMWHFIGDGPDFEQLKNDVAEKDLEDHVVLYGMQMNPFPYLAQMDAFLLLSRYEGKPIAVTEAQAMGLPCILANYTSAQEQVKQGHNGLVTDNDPDKMYEAIKNVVLNPGILAEYRENLKHSFQDNTQEIAKFYDIIKG